MLTLFTLIRLQAAFAAASLAYLIASGLRLMIMGEPLSPAPLVPSILMFVVYSLVLFLPGMGRTLAWRLSMIPALILFGVGGVFGNVLRFVQTGTEFYASTFFWALAVAINGFGTVLNIIALFGFFRSEGEVS